MRKPILNGYALAGINLYDSTPIGNIMETMSEIMPVGWMRCNHAELKQSDYPDLYKLLKDVPQCKSENEGYFCLPDYGDESAPYHIIKVAYNSVAHADDETFYGPVKFENEVEYKGKEILSKANIVDTVASGNMNAVSSNAVSSKYNENNVYDREKSIAVWNNGILGSSQVSLSRLLTDTLGQVKDMRASNETRWWAYDGRILSWHYYEGSGDYLPSKYCFVITIRWHMGRGCAIAIDWRSNIRKMYFNTLHDDTTQERWADWKEVATL